MTALSQAQRERQYQKVTAKLGGDSFVRAIPLIAQMRCRNGGIKLVWTKGGPKTDGKTIWMTDPGLNPDQRTAVMMLGDLSHEKGHVIDTDWSVVKACAHDPLLKALLNATEDPRIELVVGRQSPVELRDIRESAMIMAEDGKVATSWESPTEAFKSYVNLFGEVTFVGCVGLEEAMLKAREVVLNELGENRMTKLEGYLSAAYPGLKSTADAARMAQRLLTMLKEFADEDEKDQEQQQQQQQQSGSESGDQSSGDQQQSGDSGSQPGDQSSGDQQSGSSSQAGESGDQKGSAPSGGAQKILDGSVDPDKSVVDRRDGLEEMIESDRERQEQSSGRAGGASVLDAGLGDPRVIHPNPRRATILMSSVKADVRRIALALQRLVAKAKRAKKTVGTVGTSLVGSRLAGVPHGDYRVFSQQKPGRFRKCAIKLLLDLSDSMKGGDEFLASQATLILSEACHSAKIPFEVDAFNGYKLFRAKAFDQSFPACRDRLAGFDSVVDGGTPLGQAMFSSALPLVTHEEERKFFFVVTDGSPSDRNRVLDMAKRLKGDGVEVVGIGIGSDAVKSLFDSSVVIRSATDLAPTLIELLRTRIIKSK